MELKLLWPMTWMQRNSSHIGTVEKHFLSPNFDWFHWFMVSGVSHPQQVVVYKQESFKAAGVIEDNGLRTQTTVHSLTCTRSGDVLVLSDIWARSESQTIRFGLKGRQTLPASPSSVGVSSDSSFSRWAGRSWKPRGFLKPRAAGKDDKGTEKILFSEFLIIVSFFQLSLIFPFKHRLVTQKNTSTRLSHQVITAQSFS